MNFSKDNIKYVLFILLSFMWSEKVLCLDNGFGEEYEWESSLQKGLESARVLDKPVMLIIHKSWCGACKSLKPKFAVSKEILALSKYFVMINVMDDDEPGGTEYSPDGSYIPRILFITPEGSVMSEIFNEMGSHNHKYFYSQVDQIVISMKKVLIKLKIPAHEEL